MYAYIKGELAETNPDHIVIETGGIGYQVFISGQTFEYFPVLLIAGLLTGFLIGLLAQELIVRLRFLIEKYHE